MMMNNPILSATCILSVCLLLVLLRSAAEVAAVKVDSREEDQGSVMIANNNNNNNNEPSPGQLDWDDLLLDTSDTSVHDVATALNRRLQQSSSHNNFDHVCKELRTIFHEQCSCGGGETIIQDGIGNVIASNELLSDQVACDYSGIHAVALFNQDLANDPFQVQKMNSLKVCKRPNKSTGNRSKGRVCTTIYYSDNVGTHCDVTVGIDYSSDTAKCDGCDMCQTTKGLMGLQIDCDNIDPSVSTSLCTAATQILELSAAPAAPLLFAGTTTSLVIVTTTLAAVAFFLVG